MDNLARDSTAAIKAGMSYGKWKALHPHTKREAEQESENARPCRRCGKPIPSELHPNFKYCSAECSHAATNERVRNKYREKVGFYEAKKNAYQKLTEEEVMEARKERAKGATFPEIAKRYGVGTSTIRRAIVGETWKSFPMEGE